MKQFFKKKEGSLIIESLVASSLVIVGLLGLFRLMYVSALKSQEAVHRLQAVYLASEGIEVVKNIIDNNLVTNSPFGNNLFQSNQYLSYDSTTVVPANSIIYFNNGIFSPPNFQGQSRTLFLRNIEINSDNTTVSVTSTVSWVENNGQSNQVVLSDKFYNWRK